MLIEILSRSQDPHRYSLTSEQDFLRSLMENISLKTDFCFRNAGTVKATSTLYRYEGEYGRKLRLSCPQEAKATFPTGVL